MDFSKLNKVFPAANLKRDIIKALCSILSVVTTSASSHDTFIQNKIADCNVGWYLKAFHERTHVEV